MFLCHRMLQRDIKLTLHQLAAQPVSGTPRAVSHLETVLSLTDSAAASYAWVSRRFSRSRRMALPVT